MMLPASIRGGIEHLLGRPGFRLDGDRWSGFQGVHHVVRRRRTVEHQHMHPRVGHGRYRDASGSDTWSTLTFFCRPGGVLGVVTVKRQAR
jgi:hypothetical protein